MSFDYFLNDRKAYIVHLLEKNGSITTEQVCAMFHIAPSTGRKLLKDMEREGLLIRTFGGARCMDSGRDETLRRRLIANARSKRAIAAAARKHIKNGETVAFGGGTTVLQLAQLCRDAEHMIALTDALSTAEVLLKNPATEVRICSGIIQRKSACVIGPTATDLFRKMDVDKVFLGADSINTSGVFSNNLLVSEVERSMAGAAREVIILCDSSKLDMTSVVLTVPLSKVSLIITDRPEDLSFIRELEEQGVGVELV